MRDDRADQIAAFVVFAGLSVTEAKGLTVREADAITRMIEKAGR